MIPRGQLDIGWSHLAYALAGCVRPFDEDGLERRVAAASAGDDTLVTLSVRSGLDLLLTALDLPAGSEILVSAATIGGMVEIIEHHGLVPVPVEVDMDDLSVSVEALEAAAGPDTRAVLVAHLFGSRMPLGAVGAWCGDRGLLLIEDCAQAFAADGYWGHAAADVALTSFGPIKTATALGGAVVRARDPALRAAMAEVADTHPRQSRLAFAARVLRCAALKALLWRPAYAALCRACRALGRDHDALVGAATRGFGGADLIRRIRRRPSPPLLDLLALRLERYRPRRILWREAAAGDADERLDGVVVRPGTRARRHTHWVYPVIVDDPDDLVAHLWARGYDATPGRWSLSAVPEHPLAPGRAAPETVAALERTVFLPVGPWLRRGELDGLAEAVRAWAAARSAASPGQ